MRGTGDSTRGGVKENGVSSSRVSLVGPISRNGLLNRQGTSKSIQSISQRPTIG